MTDRTEPRPDVSLEAQIAAVRISEWDASNIARGAAEHDPETSAQFRKRAKALRAALATLEAARWQPIAEAPKDGTDILITNRGVGMLVRIAFWDEARGGGWSVWPGREQWATPPTHWSSLPEPPSDG